MSPTKKAKVTVKKSASVKRREAIQDGDLPTPGQEAVMGNDAAAVQQPLEEGEVYENAEDARVRLKRDAAYGQRRSDGEVEGITVNTDQYQGPTFDNVRAEYVDAQKKANSVEVEV